MEDADDATTDAILALQLQDLASLGGNLDNDDSDRTDMDIAINLYRQELDQLAVSVRDQHVGFIINSSYDDDAELPTSIPSPIPLYDQLHNQSSADTPSLDVLLNQQVDVLPVSVPNRLERFTQEVPGQASTDPQTDGSYSITPTEVIGHQVLDECGGLAEQSSHHVSTEAEERTSSVEKVENAARPFRRPNRLLAALRDVIRSIPWFTDPGQSTKEVKSGETCLACGDHLSPTEQLRVPCGDSYCHQCMAHLFESAMKDDSLFPPQCCDELIPFGLVDHLFNTRFAAVFHEREIELSTSHRIYCANPSCSIFIKADNIKDGKGTCPVCSTETCVTCKGTAHEEECPEDPGIKSLMALAETEGYKQCHACKRIIELTFGCNHMTYVSIRLSDIILLN